MPPKPTITAHQRYARTRSLRNTAASATVISGAENWIAVASTSGNRASAEKLKNMPPMLTMPRPRWPRSRAVRTAVINSLRQA